MRIINTKQTKDRASLWALVTIFGWGAVLIAAAIVEAVWRVFH